MITIKIYVMASQLVLCMSYPTPQNALEPSNVQKLAPISGTQNTVPNFQE